MTDVTLTRNSGLKRAGLVLESSEMNAVGSTFIEFSGLQGCVLSILRANNVTFEACQLRNLHCTGNILDFLETQV